MNQSSLLYSLTGDWFDARSLLVDWTWRGNLLPPGTFHERRPYSLRERYANDRLANSIVPVGRIAGDW